MESLDQWIDRQYRHAGRAMMRSISPVDLVKDRPGFGQSIRAAKGAVIASPVLGAYDPDPDYFFHWFRDSAIVIDALRLLYEDGSVGKEALMHLADFVHFSLELAKLDGRTLVADARWRSGIAPDFEKFVRADAELAAAHGDGIASETRVNPDGTLDISKWGRPQNDGPALRALCLLRWARSAHLDAKLSTALSRLLRSDLDFTIAHWRDACYDIWEEEKGCHYYTLCVAAAALEDGAVWLQSHGQPAMAQASRKQVTAIRKMLDGYWLEPEGYYRSRTLQTGARSTKELDIAVILAAIHAPNAAATHSVHDAKMHATLKQLEELFSREYLINRERPVGRGPAMGRYAGDVYYSGGAYFFSTLGASEFCFRTAQASRDPDSWVARGDGYLRTVRAYTPDNGDLSEQFDKQTGTQTSAKQLAWSYAAFISCVAARRRVASRAS
jgi:glucoamylase